jgi:hypothetical protein
MVVGRQVSESCNSNLSPKKTKRLLLAYNHYQRLAIYFGTFLDGTLRIAGQGYRLPGLGAGLVDGLALIQGVCITFSRESKFA